MKIMDYHKIYEGQHYNLPSVLYNKSFFAFYQDRDTHDIKFISHLVLLE
jgi:hypothetical protein